MQVLHNFNMLKEENGVLKNQLENVTIERDNSSRGNEKVSKTDINLEIYEHVDFVLSKKANKYLHEEVGLLLKRLLIVLDFIT